MKSDKVILNALMELNGKIDNITTCLNISNEKTGHKILFPLYANINEYWKVFSKNQKNSNIDLISLALYEFIKKYAPETFKEVDLGVN